MLPNFPESLLKPILRPLVSLLFEVSEEDPDTAWANAIESVSVFDPHTLIELRLAVRVALFNVKANEAVAAANNKEIPIDRSIRLNNCAITLVREADKAEARLEKLRDARLAGKEITEEPEELTETDSPKVEKALALVQETQVVAAQAKILGVTWPQAYKQRKLEKRLAKMRERDARMASHTKAEGLPPRP